MCSKEVAMKFTEGYWLESERAKMMYAAHAYEVTEIDGGMRVLAPVKVIDSRGTTLNLPVITIEFKAVGEDAISVRAWHFEGYEDKTPAFEKKTVRVPYTVEIDEKRAVLVTGNVSVVVDRENWEYRFEAGGKVLTRCGFKNLAYVRWDGTASTQLPAANYMNDGAKPYMVNELSLSVGECVYGFGERFTAFVKNGQSIETWNEDGGTASQLSYKSVPFYMTNRGYGVFVDHTDNVSFEVASEKVEYVGFSVPGEEIRYIFFYGSEPKKILKSYTALLGRPALPPAWSFGLWLSTSFTTNYDEATVTSFIDGMLKRDLPLSVFHFDCFWMKEFHWCDFEWDDRVFPNVREMLARYKAKGLKICVWINPYIAQNTALFKEGAEKGYLLKRSDGMGVWQTDLWQAGMGVVDFTNKEACAWYSAQLQRLLDMGVDCFKTDFGERIPTDVSYFDGSNAEAMHNYYTYLYNQCVFNTLREVKGEAEAVVFARSATAGCQQFPVHWGGDCMASYPSMAETLRGGLSFAMSGFSFWSHDISGFESTATADLYKRWTAFGLLSTHSRLHGSGSYRVPWLFDEESCDVLRFFTKLKCRLMPYIYSKAVEAHRDGTPLMRPMVFEYPNDRAAAFADCQYMLGDNLLAAPVFSPSGEAEYYLPDGCWTDFFTGEVKAGGRYYKNKYDYFSLPLYVRPASIIAVGSTDCRPDYDYGKDVTFHVYELLEGQSTQAEVVDMAGNTLAHIFVTKEDGKYRTKGTENLENYKFIIHENGEEYTL